MEVIFCIAFANVTKMFHEIQIKFLNRKGRRMKEEKYSDVSRDIVLIILKMVRQVHV